MALAWVQHKSERSCYDRLDLPKDITVIVEHLGRTSEKAVLRVYDADTVIVKKTMTVNGQEDARQKALSTALATCRNYAKRPQERIRVLVDSLKELYPDTSE